WKRLLNTIDVLVDGPFILAEKSLELKFRGSRNQRILKLENGLVTGRLDQ
ncbi:4Fe-4S cluster-binding domain-containing protein, partial [bacterium]|nr:4Fe-4S cluster-binding domain-containing protein [bacterium]